MARWLVHGVWAALVLVVLALNVALPLPGQEDSRPWATGLMAFPAAGALLLVRRPGNRVGQLLTTVGATAGIVFTGTWAALEHPDAAWSPHVEALAAAGVVVQFWALLSLLYVYPTGAPSGKAGRWSLAAFTAWAAIMAPLGVIRPGPLDVTGRDNPFGVGPAWLASLFEAGLVGLVVGALVGVVVLLGRRRRAGAVERAQLKWFASGSFLLLAVIALIALVPDGDAEPVAFVVVVAGFWALPAAVVTAVLRYRLYAIDRLVSRSVTYGVVASLLLVVYALSVFLLSALLPAQDSLAVAGSTLAAAALLHPLRRAVQRAVDRRFNRPRYDAEREVGRFVSHLQEELDLDGLRVGLVAVVTATMQPSGVAVWLREGAVAGGAGQRARR